MRLRASQAADFEAVSEKRKDFARCKGELQDMQADEHDIHEMFV